ncbi:MAG: hypothetical protein V1644_02855 [Candidatus Micrarchaeota archaeon]
MPLEAYYKHGGLDKRLAPVHKAIFRHLLRITELPYAENVHNAWKLPETEWEIGRDIEKLTSTHSPLASEVEKAVKAAGLHERTHSKFKTAHGYAVAVEAEHLIARGILMRIATRIGLSDKPRYHITINPALLPQIAQFVEKK